MKDINDEIEDEIYPWMMENEEMRMSYVVPFATALFNADESEFHSMLDEVATEYKNTIESNYESFIDFAGEIICDLDSGEYISDDGVIAEEKKEEYENALSLIMIRTNMVCHDKLLFAPMVFELLNKDPEKANFKISDFTSNSIFVHLRKKIMNSSGLW
jgi:hypothetical protein